MCVPKKWLNSAVKKKWKKIFLCKNNFGKYFFKKKKMFLNFLSQKVTNFCSKKKTNEKKYFFYKNKFGKNFFIKNKLENIFLEKKIWKYVFSLFSREGQLSRGPIIRQIRVYPTPKKIVLFFGKRKTGEQKITYNFSIYLGLILMLQFVFKIF